MESEKILFIVPNNDLEAKTIQKILLKRGHDFLITNQNWGASYDCLEEDILKKINEYDIVYFIELTEVPNKKNYIIIDHHGENALENHSSLEQVAEIIGYELTEEEHMISQNDKSYFEGMLEYQLANKIDFHSAKRKCMEIRKKDWESQGITESQVQEALKSIKYREYINGKCVIRCSHSKTAPIMDNMFWEEVEYIILSEDGEINIDATTKSIMNLKEKFPNSWFGGRLTYGKGYWGTTSYSQQEVLEYFLNM